MSIIQLIKIVFFWPTSFSLPFKPENRSPGSHKFMVEPPPLERISSPDDENFVADYQYYETKTKK